jgi:hypothetical protein
VPGLIGGGGSSQPIQQIPFNAGGTGQGGTVYTPSAQPQFDQTYQSLLNNLYGQYTAGATPPQQNFPLAENAALNIAMNPFAPQQLQGAQAISPFEQQVGGGAINTAIALGSLPNAVSDLGNTVASQIPALQNLSSTVAGYMAPTAALGQQVAGYMAPTAAIAPQVMAGIAPLQAGAGQLLQTGMDPQSALYQQLAQRTLQNAAGANAMSGLASSPYGAGLTSDALSNMNINWENQQLARQAQALQGSGQAYGQAGALGGMGADIYGRAGQLGGEAGSLYGRAGQLGLGTGGANAYMQGAGLPYATSLAQSEAAIPALTNATNLGLSQYQLPQQVLNDIQSYLRLGQSASDLSGVLGNMGFNQGQQQLGNLGGAFGLGSNFLFGNQGLAGALGLDPATGLLGGGGLFGAGGLFGSGAGAAGADIASLAPLADLGGIGSATDFIGGPGALALLGLA